MMFQAASSHSEVDDVGIPSWVKKVPLEESPEIAALTARDVTTPFFVMAHYWDYLLSQRQDLMLVSPFQDYSDRSDLVFLAMMAPVIPLTSNSVVSHYTKVRLMGQAIPKTFVPTLTALMGLKHGFAMMMFGGSIVLSDYLTMNLSRRIAEKQGHVFGTNEDVERRPIHVASGFAMTGTVLTFLDAARPISLAWNLARWAGGGFVVCGEAFFLFFPLINSETFAPTLFFLNMILSTRGLGSSYKLFFFFFCAPSYSMCVRIFHFFQLFYFDSFFCTGGVRTGHHKVQRKADDDCRHKRQRSRRQHAEGPLQRHLREIRKGTCHTSFCQSGSTGALGPTPTNDMGCTAVYWG